MSRPKTDYELEQEDEINTLLDHVRSLQAKYAAAREALQEIADSDHLGNRWARLKARAALLQEQSDE